MELVIQAWSVWTPHWRYPNDSDGANDELLSMSWVPANARRRLSPFTKMAFKVAHSVRTLTPSETIFASRHGDLAKTLQQLHNLTAQESISPTQFALSVHNAVSGQYAIVTDNQQASTTISAGLNTFDMALIAAYARLAAMPELNHIAVVIADEPVPEVYQGHGVEHEPAAAIALRVGRKKTTDSSLFVGFRKGLPTLPSNNRSIIHQVLKFLEEQQKDLEYENAGYNWHWRRA